MKRNDKYFIAVTLLLVGLLTGVVGQNMQPATTPPWGLISGAPASSADDVAAIKKNLAAAGIVLHEAKYWQELPAN